MKIYNTFYGYAFCWFDTQYKCSSPSTQQPVCVSRLTQTNPDHPLLPPFTNLTFTRVSSKSHVFIVLAPQQHRDQFSYSHTCYMSSPSRSRSFYPQCCNRTSRTIQCTKLLVVLFSPVSCHPLCLRHQAVFLSQKFLKVLL
jgi:hypothetical protein